MFDTSMDIMKYLVANNATFSNGLPISEKTIDDTFNSFKYGINSIEFDITVNGEKHILKAYPCGYLEFDEN